MIIFEKRSNMQIIALTICTLGFYSLYWNVKTKKELVLAGGKIPSSFLMIIPFLDIYFWYCYAQSYVNIVQKNSDQVDHKFYYMLALLPAAANDLRLLLTIGSNHEFTLYTLLISIISLSIIIIKTIILQKGFNDYPQNT